ncbi:MAG: phosphate acetyltransferase [Bacillota bacterium]|nr:phosphate acetyltransferase [Bacillota bacterium]
MSLLEQIREKARQKKKIIVLPEGTEERTVKAAEILAKEQIADPILLGVEDEVTGVAKNLGVDLSKVRIIDPSRAADAESLAENLYEIRKSKGLTIDEARNLVKNPLYYGSMLVYTDAAHGLVAGAINTTGDVLRPALQTIKTAPGVSVVSGSFIMIVPDCEFGDNGMFIFADCAVNPNPTAEQLAEIAYSSAETARSLCGMEPRIGMLSYSTKGSGGKHEDIEKVLKATEIAKQRYPDLVLDGEFQADAALVPKVAKSKAPGSDVAGRVNVLIFPDLDAGNIGYKLVQRLAKAEAIGPILQGMAKPVNDLSRGCSVDDIVNVAAMCVVKAQA